MLVLVLGIDAAAAADAGLSRLAILVASGAGAYAALLSCSQRAVVDDLLRIVRKTPLPPPQALWI
jgi:hypothetical protein